MILSLFQIDGEPEMAGMCKQGGASDCGLFAIATATALAFGSYSTQFQQGSMRQHLVKCFKDGVMT